MSKLSLPNVTLMCIDCVDAHKAIRILEHCKSKVDFGDVKLLTHIPVSYPGKTKIMPLNSLIAYSIFMLTRVFQYIETDYVQIVQRDGWILNPESFNHDWLKLDYIGPIFIQYDKSASGGFSLRSKRLMENTAKNTPEWDGTDRHAHEIQKGLDFYEDGMICLSGRYSEFKVGTLEQCADYAQGGNRNPVYFRELPYGFHRTFQEIDFKTGLVDSSDLTKDLHVSYDHEIDTL